jgi:hypothetical protein
MRDDRVEGPVPTQPVWAVSDPHGHRAELVAALRARGLLDERADWAAGDATLWFLGDLFDRGPDGIGIVELVMRLQRQAADEGGRVGAVLGNHEVLALGMYRFGELKAAEVDPSVMEVQMTWLRNGGVVDDQLRLGDQHLEWLSTLPSVALQGDQLLLHSDSLRYLTYGDSIEEINASVTSALAGGLESWWDCWNNLTHRYDFARADGVRAAQQVTARLGGRRVVHGHSFVADLARVPLSEVSTPYLYAEGAALGIDGGLYAGGPLLVVDLAR